MAWIRTDCSILDDEFLIDTLTGDEFKAWALFLVRVKAIGARGSVAVAPIKSLARNWNLPESSIASMLDKAKRHPNGDGKPGLRIYEDGGRWYVKNWKKYQEDYKHANTNEFRGPSSEKTGDGPNGTTLPHNNTTPQDRTRALCMRPTSPGVVSEYLQEIECPNPQVEGEKFFDYYTGNGWRVGKNPMRDWKAAARNWKRNVNSRNTNEPSKTQPGSQAARATYRPSEQSRADNRAVAESIRRMREERGERP